MKAIETRYKGYRFRSRLEARWAVFFDAADIEWQYEKEGFNLSWRLSLKEGTFSYLPDFWLPEFGLWAEVKGQLNDDELVKLLNAAAALSSNDGSGCHDSGGNDMLVLGQIPTPVGGREQRMPVRLHMHKGNLMPLVWPIEPSCYGRLDAFASDWGGPGLSIIHSDFPVEGIKHLLLDGAVCNSTPPARYVHALKVARSARFEHGETGAPRKTKSREVAPTTSIIAPAKPSLTITVCHSCHEPIVGLFGRCKNCDNPHVFGQCDSCGENVTEDNLGFTYDEGVYCANCETVIGDLSIEEK